MAKTAEEERLDAHRARAANWRDWGPYLSERAWGTVREDYSADGNAWSYLPHEHARSHTYRWNEDGLAGICNRYQTHCFALALWNGRDPYLKERLFGLSNPQGNHGEDVKEIYYYLDSTPTHSYMKMLYRYGQRAFPYDELIEQNAARGYGDDEFELLQTGYFDDNAFFDVFVEYAKGGERDILVRIEAHNRSESDETLHLLPTLWFRNTWSWGYDSGPKGSTGEKPSMACGPSTAEFTSIQTHYPTANGVGSEMESKDEESSYYLYAEALDDDLPALLFTENETNFERLYDSPNSSPYVKDAFHRCVVNGETQSVNPKQVGTKAAAHYCVTVAAGESIVLRLRLTADEATAPFSDHDAIVQRRRQEADAFYDVIINPHATDEQRRVQRQAFAGLFWTKQLYYYDIEQWLRGDPAMPPPPPSHQNGRNSGWRHLTNFDIMSMPDKWEYPYYAVWDTAFHCLPIALADPDYAKRQLELFTREWYMHPNGQLPAYEWNFSDVNPPVHAWAAWRVYKIEGKHWGRSDRAWLEGIFHKLLLNFTWWVNRKDEEGHNIFEGGFLGMDNISPFDRSAELPLDAHIEQADGTAWMAAYCLMMMKIALELAKEEPVYQDSATKFLEHFLRIASAIASTHEGTYTLWHEEDSFFYDHLHFAQDSEHQNHSNHVVPIRVRSMVGLLTLTAVETLSPDLLEAMPVFTRRMDWFMHNRPDLSENVASVDEPGQKERRLLSILTEDKLRRTLAYLLDENEFLSPFGIRSLSKYHLEHPYDLELKNETRTVTYWPGEARSGLFGGNSNWRGPVWFPVNYLLIEALQRYHHYYGDDFTVEMPTGSGNHVTLWEVATELSQRLMRLFLRDKQGCLPIFDPNDPHQNDPLWRHYLLFHEYFHGDNGRGLGASHQTGWTSLVAKLLQQSGGDMLSDLADK